MVFIKHESCSVSNRQVIKRQYSQKEGEEELNEEEPEEVGEVDE